MRSWSSLIRLHILLLFLELGILEMDVVFVFVFFAIFQPVLLYTFEEQRQISKDYGNCLPFFCGKLGELKSPYTNITSNPECPFVVDGCDKEIQNIQFTRGGRWYEVERISQANVITITDEEFKRHLNFKSCESFNNLSLPNHIPQISLKIMSNLTLFKCDTAVNLTSHFDYSYQGCKKFNIYYNSGNRTLRSLPANCSMIQLPANKSNSYSDISGLLTAKFSLYTIWSTGNICQNSTGKVQCVEARSGLNQRLRGSLKLGLGLGVPAAILFLPTLFILHRYKRKKASSSLLSRENKCIETFLRKNGTLAPKRYSYSEVKKMTKTFKEKLGQGGYGSVFKGNLPDGHLVAVKVLKESKSKGEEFVNEVSSIGRTSHVNIVTLLGFCFEGSKRALIYEFMSNGSLDKHIYEENLLKADRQLRWETLHQIAVGIARGLEYLHRGCNTRILHFDIKPHNVLLDENFFPKISDFGLAKICPRKESIVSMLGARGTVGYIAPEVICRNFGGVSHKSDVYSYGMLVLEMIGGRKNICVGVDNISEIYFPHWIYKRLELGEELQLRGIGNEAEGQIARKMILASLWCIQTDPSNRPPMSRVVEMLQGSLESLPIPPRPYLSSPARSPHGSIENLSTTIILRV